MGRFSQGGATTTQAVRRKESDRLTAVAFLEALIETVP
jgi:hypothetical protein